MVLRSTADQLRNLANCLTFRASVSSSFVIWCPSYARRTAFLLQTLCWSFYFFPTYTLTCTCAHTCTHMHTQCTTVPCTHVYKHTPMNTGVLLFSHLNYTQLKLYLWPPWAFPSHPNCMLVWTSMAVTHKTFFHFLVMFGLCVVLCSMSPHSVNYLSLQAQGPL